MKVKLGDLLEPQLKSKVKAGEGLSSGKYRFFTSSIVENKYINSYKYNQEALILGTGGNANIHYCIQPFNTSTDCLVMYGKPSVNLKIIYYYLRENIYLLEAGFKGAGLKHISKDYILNLIIKLPCIEKQNYIVKILDRIEILIDLQKQQLKKLDLLVKSRFIELFGDSQNNNRNFFI